MNGESTCVVYNSLHVLEYDQVELQKDMTYIEYPLCILAREVRKLRNRTILYVKLQWNNHPTREATWELEDVMRESYSHLFD